MSAPVRIREIEAAHNFIDRRKSKNELTRLIYFPQRQSGCHASQAPPDLTPEIKLPTMAAATLTSSQLLLLPPEIILNMIPMLPYPEYVHFEVFSSPSGAVSSTLSQLSEANERSE